MAKLSQFTELTQTLDVSPRGIPVQFTYRPGAWNGEMERWFEQNASLDGSGYELLRRLLERWDLTDEKDRPIPFTDKALEAVPSWVLADVINAIREDISPGE